VLLALLPHLGLVTLASRVAAVRSRDERLAGITPNGVAEELRRQSDRADAIFVAPSEEKNRERGS
jgi:hypothetical protein